LTEPGAAAKADARVESALGQGRRLKTLIDRLLDVSRMAAGRLELSRERVDLAELAREVVDGLREHAAAAGSELRLRVEGGATAGEWDRARVEQVLVNLLSNALKYGAGKPVDVTVEGAGGVARFSVADRGIGLSEVDLGRLFGRFERMAPVRHYAGLGLGLYISRHLVEAHGGAIRVASRPGEGATFTIELPTTTTATPREGAPRPPPARGPEEPTP
jgi:signal transduction histidine kinase